MARRALVQRTRAPRWAPRNGRMMLEPLALVVLVSIIVGVVLLFALRLRGEVFVIVSFVYAVCVAIFVMMVQRRTDALDRQLIPLLQREDTRAVNAVLERAWLARTLGDRAHVGRRRGLVAYLDENYGDAERFFEMAWQRSNPEARYDLVAPLCRVKFELKKIQDMRELAEDWARIDDEEGPSGWYLAYGKLESEGIGDTELEGLVAEAGPPLEAIDARVRDAVYRLMSARGDDA